MAIVSRKTTGERPADLAFGSRASFPIGVAVRVPVAFCGTTMTEQTPAELAKRIEALERRVSELESKHDESPTDTSTDTTSGLDRRDKTVLQMARENGGLSPRQTVLAYKNHTDITRDKTARRRAKQLQNNPRYEEVVENEE